MQNRRLHNDDWRGVGEDLNETNKEQVGIQVNTRYFLQLFNYSNTESLQRKIQLAVDEPVMFFVTAGKGELGARCPAPEVTVPDFDGDLKVHLLPLDRMKMLVRLENMSDLFDGTPSEMPMFDLKQYV